MASIRKKANGRWSVEICINGVRRSKVFDTKAQCRSWANEEEFNLSRARDGISHTHTLQDVFHRYLEEVSSHKKGFHWEQVRLNMLSRFPIAGAKLIDLRREDFENLIRDRMKTVKPSTVNRELNLISHCLTEARRWRLMSHNPLKDLKRPKNPPHRDRRVTQDEIERLAITHGYIEGCTLSETRQRVYVAFLVAIETAMRAGELCSIEVRNIDLKKRVVHLPETKNGTARDVPLTNRAVELFDGLIGASFDPVFGVSSGSLSTIFRKYTTKAGIDGLTFHDSRHEAITRLAGKLDVLDLARMVGHRDIRQLQTYYNMQAEEIAKRLD